MILFNTDMRGFGASIMEVAPESDRIPSENGSQVETGNGGTEPSNNFIVDWLATEEPTEPNVCQSNVLALALNKQAYVDGGTLLDSGELRIDGVSRSALLGFSLQDVPPTFTSAHLEMTVGEDNGYGVLMLGLGSHHDWQAGQSSDNVPDISALINEYAGKWESGNRHALPIDPALLNDETVSILLSMQSEANDTSIVADVDLPAPTLVLNGDSSFCDQYNSNRSAREAAIEAANEASTQAENALTNSEASESGGTLTEAEIEALTEAEADTAEETGSSEATTDAGALTLLSSLFLLFLVLFKHSIVIRKILR